MKTYVDEHYLFAADTLLLYSGNMQNIKVPAVISGNQVKCLGGGAFGSQKILKSVRVEEGIEEIGPECFYECINLEHIYLPGSVKKVGSGAFIGGSKLRGLEFRGMTMEVSQFRAMCAAGVKAYDGGGSRVRLFAGMPYGFPCEGLEAAFSAMTGFPSRLPFAETCLFMTENADDRTDKSRYSFGIGSDRLLGLGEAEMMRELFRNRKTAGESAAGVLANDQSIRFSRHERKKCICLPVVEEEAAEEQSGLTIFRAHIYVGYVFFPIVQHIVVKGKEYGLCLRLYLDPQRSVEYLREPVCVLGEDGSPVENSEEVESVYRKFMLASMF